MQIAVINVKLEQCTRLAVTSAITATADIIIFLDWSCVCWLYN